MEFTFFGGGTVLITTKELKLVSDPSTSPKAPKAEVELRTLKSEPGFNDDGGFTIQGAGEFEVKGVGVTGIAAQLHVDQPKDPFKGVMYTVDYKGVRALITGNIAPTLKEQQLEMIGNVNVLIIPVGGHGLTLDAPAASALVGQLEPNFVLPIHYDDGVAKYLSPQDKLAVFLKEIGSEDATPVPKLKVTTNDLIEGTQVVVLKPSG